MIALVLIMIAFIASTVCLGKVVYDQKRVIKYKEENILKLKREYELLVGTYHSMGAEKCSIERDLNSARDEIANMKMKEYTDSKIDKIYFCPNNNITVLKSSLVEVAKL